MSKPLGKKHNLKHLEKVYKVTDADKVNGNEESVTGSNFASIVPLGLLVNKDLKRSAFLILVIITLIIILGFVVYKTDIFNGILGKFSLNY